MKLVSFSQKLWLKNFYCIFFRTSCAITFQPIILMYRRCIYNFIVHSLIPLVICMCGSEFTLKLDCGVAIFPNNLSLIIKLMCFLKLLQCKARPHSLPAVYQPFWLVHNNLVFFSKETLDCEIYWYPKCYSHLILFLV